MKSLIRLFPVLFVASFFFASCEGPAGPTGKDANESCKECHNPTVVDQKSVEFDFSKHKYGEAAFEEAGNAACSPCHESEAFKYVSKNNIPSTFTLVNGKYVNDYSATTSIAYGELTCSTCHSNIHTSYTGEDFFPLTSVAPVAMTMWKGTKTINLTQDDSKSNLCVKCHQPRPLTTSTSLSNGDIVDYPGLASSPTTVFYDNAVGNAAPNKVLPSYRMHVHYGTVGAIYAGQGGVEFTGTQTYTNSAHTSSASCQDCHMAPITGRAGGHTFVAKGNFNGCNVTGCHTGLTASSTTFWKTTRDEIQGLLNSLATKINAVGGATPILHSDGTESNLWATLTTGKWDGYLNVYDPSANPLAAWRNPAPSNSWTTDQKATNTALPVFPSLKNVNVGAMINFQMALREYSLGIHNYKYTKALLQNSIEALTAAGY
jgi:hypothetical protein